MTWIGTRFSLVLGGLRLRVRVVLEDAAPRRRPAPRHPARREEEAAGSERMPAGWLRGPTMR